MKNNTPPSDAPHRGIDITPDPDVVQRLLETLAAWHGIAMETKVRKHLKIDRDDLKDERPLKAGHAAYLAYWKTLKVVVAELTADIDTSDVEAAVADQVKKGGSK